MRSRAPAVAFAHEPHLAANHSDVRRAQAGAERCEEVAVEVAGFCHVDRSNPIAFGDAYGAGIVDAGAAVGP